MINSKFFEIIFNLENWKYDMLIFIKTLNEGMCKKIISEDNNSPKVTPFKIIKNNKKDKEELLNQKGKSFEKFDSENIEKDLNLNEEKKNDSNNIKEISSFEKNETKKKSRISNLEQESLDNMNIEKNLLKKSLIFNEKLKTLDNQKDENKIKVDSKDEKENKEKVINFFLIYFYSSYLEN